MRHFPMLQKSHPICSSLNLAIVLALSVFCCNTTHAKDSPDSIAIIQQSLPDSISLKDKVVYVDFWASWCLPCLQSFPWMQTTYNLHKTKNFEVVAICVDKDHKAALEFLEKHKPTFPVIFDSTGALADFFNLKAMPSSFLFGRDGKLKTTHKGFDENKIDSLSQAITNLVNKESHEK